MIKAEDLAQAVATMINWLHGNTGSHVTIVVMLPEGQLVGTTDPEGPVVALDKARAVMNLAQGNADTIPPPPSKAN